MTEFKNGDLVVFTRTVDREEVRCVVVGPDPRNIRRAIVCDLGDDLFISIERDRLRPHREPVKVSGWVNVYANGDHGPLRSQKGFSDYVGTGYDDAPVPIACVYVSGTEGEEP